MPDIESHERVNDILLGPLERPVLKWLAAHMPAWANPDTMTGVGIFGAAVVFTGYYLTNLDKGFLWLVNLGFVLNWFGDSLDGTLARYRKIERPRYGFFIDRTVDTLSEFLVFTGLGLSPYMKLEISLFAFIGYLFMSIMVYVRTCVDGHFQISYAKLGPTELRVIVIVANTLLFFVGNPTVRLPIGSVTIFDLFGIAIAAALVITFIISTIKQARYLAKLDAT
jgi:phosphatidylglycerophosphate synthase